MTSQDDMIQHLLKDALNLEDSKITIINGKRYKGINKLRVVKLNTLDK